MIDLTCGRYYYPHRSILKDVLSRSNTDVSSSLFGLPGCREILVKQNADLNEYDLDVILRGAKDYDASKNCPTDRNDSELELSASERRSDYYTRVEDIDPRWIHDYARDVIIGFRKNNSGLKTEKKLDYEVNYFVDNETGDSRLATDFEIQQEKYSVAETVEAKRKLPYVLKVLHNGSKIYGISLLSVLIAYLRHKAKNDSVKPGKIATENCIWRVTYDGQFSSLCTPQDNAYAYEGKRGYRYIMSWILDAFDDPADKAAMEKYTRACSDLIHIADVLGVKLADEEPTDYGKDVIDKATCLYLESNKTFIQDKIEADPELLKLLTKEQLFSCLTHEVEDEKQRLSVSELAEVTAQTVNIVSIRQAFEHKKRPDMCHTAFSVSRVKLVDEFLVQKLHVDRGISKYEQRDNCLYNTERNDFVYLSGRSFTNQSEFMDSRYIISVTGNLVLLDEDIVVNRGILRYISIADILAGNELRGQYVEV